MCVCVSRWADHKTRVRIVTRTYSLKRSTSPQVRLRRSSVMKLPLAICMACDLHGVIGFEPPMGNHPEAKTTHRLKSTLRASVWCRRRIRLRMASVAGAGKPIRSVAAVLFARQKATHGCFFLSFFVGDSQTVGFSFGFPFKPTKKGVLKEKDTPTLGALPPRRGQAVVHGVFRTLTWSWVSAGEPGVSPGTGVLMETRWTCSLLGK